MAKVIFKQGKCTGCSACTVVAPDLFKMVDTDQGQRSSVVNPSKEEKTDEGLVQERELKTDEELQQAKEAVDVCPAECIILEE